MGIENGEVLINNEKDLKTLLKFIRENIIEKTYNDNTTKVLLEGVDKLENTYSMLYQEVNNIDGYKKKSILWDKIEKKLTQSQTMSLLKGELGIK